LLARTYANSGLVDRVPPLVNTVITNVPGVNMPLYSMGSKMVATYGLGPVVHGVGLFQPVLSYNDTITISAVADRSMMPDPDFYVECLQASYDELKAATIDKPKAEKAPSKQPRKIAAKKSGGRRKKVSAAPKRKASRKKSSNGDARPTNS
jgi:diacylglycerol O-acyltransferase